MNHTYMPVYYVAAEMDRSIPGVTYRASTMVGLHTQG